MVASWCCPHGGVPWVSSWWCPNIGVLMVLSSWCSQAGVHLVSSWWCLHSGVLTVSYGDVLMVGVLGCPLVVLMLVSFWFCPQCGLMVVSSHWEAGHICPALIRTARRVNRRFCTLIVCLFCVKRRAHGHISFPNTHYSVIDLGQGVRICRWLFKARGCRWQF